MNFVCSDTTAYDPFLVERLSARFALSPVAVRALLRRNLNTPEAIEAFLHPEAQPLPDWREMKGMAEAAHRTGWETHLRLRRLRRRRRQRLRHPVPMSEEAGGGRELLYPFPSFGGVWT